MRLTTYATSTLLLMATGSGCAHFSSADASLHTLERPVEMAAPMESCDDSYARLVLSGDGLISFETTDNVKDIEKVLGHTSAANKGYHALWVCLDSASWASALKAAPPGSRLRVTAEDALREKFGATTVATSYQVDIANLSGPQRWGFPLPGAKLGVLRITFEVYDTNGESVTKSVKFDPGHLFDEDVAQLRTTEDAVAKDDDVRADVRRAAPGCDPTEVINDALRQANAAAASPFVVPRFRARTFLPTAGTVQPPPQLLWVDATQGDRTERDLYPLAGQTMRVWALNLTSPQALAVVQGPAAGSTELGVLVAYGLTAAAGAPLGAAPSAGSAPAATSPAAAAADAGCEAKCTSPSCVAECHVNDDANSTAKLPAPGGACVATPAILTSIEAAVNKRLADSETKTKYHTDVAFPSLTGEYNYVAEILDPTFGKGSKKGDGGTPPLTPSRGTAVSPTTPVVASETFKSRAAHRPLSVAVEEAWSWGPKPASGYGYVPVSQSGPDQLYQLQQVSHAADQLTFSALFVAYPGPIFGHGAHRPFWDGILLGFGPTLVRGGTAEAFRQWNVRLGYECHDVTLSAGVSWRNLDVPQSPSLVGSVASVPKPGSAPGFATVGEWEPLASIALGVDLDIIAAGVSSIAASAKGGK